MTPKTEYRIKYKCECRVSVYCKTRVVGQTLSCLKCSREFVVPHPPESFWHVHPNRSMDDHEEHAKSICEYAVVVWRDKTLFLKNVRQIIRTLSDIRLFAESYAEQHEEHRNKDVEKALERMSRGSTFAGYSNPNLRQSRWTPIEKHVPVVAYVRVAIKTLRLRRIELKESKNSFD